MREITLTRGRVSFVDDDDFELVSKFKWSCKDTGYAEAKVYGKNTYLHRLVMNAQKGDVVDHLDGNRLNNQKINLRICNQRENTQNRNGVLGFRVLRKSFKIWKIELTISFYL